jgi:hypothetical protein
LSDAGSCGKASGVVDGSWSFLFGPLTMTVSRIRGKIRSGYFAEGMGSELGEETISEPQPDEAVVFEEFFNAGLRMPSHPVLADILLKFQVQIHQLTPNAVVQLSKYIWAVLSFGGVPSAEGFMKRYELHYQLRKIDVDGVELLLQYGCFNFHAKRGGQRAKLTVAVQNNWSRAWTQALFYCKVHLIQIVSPRRGKGIFTLHSYMTRLDFVMEPSFQCPDDEAGEVAFIKATRAIGGRDAVEEYMACGLFPLSASFSLGEIAEGETLVLKLAVPLPKFPVARRPEEMNYGFWAKVELAAVHVLGRYARGEHMVWVESVPNGGRVNKVFEQAGLPYGRRLERGSEEYEEATKERKNDAGAEPSRKCAKVSGQKVMLVKMPMASKVRARSR